MTSKLFGAASFAFAFLTGIVFGFDNRKDADCLCISTRNQLELPVTTLRKAASKTPRGARMYAAGGETVDVPWPRVLSTIGMFVRIRNGFVIVREFLNQEEIELLEGAREDRVLESTFLRSRRSRGQHRAPFGVESSNRHNLRRGGAFVVRRELSGNAFRRRRVPLSLQDDYEGCKGHRRVDLASGLRKTLL